MLQLRGVTKRFGTFTALEAVDFAVGAGEIVGLLGENGAGKSTLMNLIGGLHQPDGGEMHWDGQPIRLASPRDATARGIGVVHQHFMLVPVFSVAENMALHAPQAGAVFNADRWAACIEAWARSLGWRVDARRRVEELSVGERQRVEILKALFARTASQKTKAESEAANPDADETARLLLLDEPTANLTPAEAGELFGVLRGLRARGYGIVFVSHKLREVMALCDRVVVLRRGRIVGEHSVSQTNVTDLATLMVGREMSVAHPLDVASRLADASSATSTTRVEASANAARLTIRNLSCGLLRDFSLQVRGGEIVGLAGVDGNGQQELMEVLGSLRLPQTGSFAASEASAAYSAGQAPSRAVGEARHAARHESGTRGLSIIPADRQSVGLIQSFDLAENMALSRDLRAACRGRFAFDWPLARRTTRELMERFDVRAPATRERTPAANLSGGNAQKLVVARALQWSRGVVVAAEPTRGLDVGAARFVREQLRRAADRGRAVLLVSTDLDEIFELSDRIGVLYEGRLLPDENLLPPHASRETIGAMMGGLVQGKRQK